MHQPRRRRRRSPKEFVSIVDEPTLPRVLLMGDSVSIAYAPDFHGVR
jgi:hypothetical protein